MIDDDFDPMPEPPVTPDDDICCGSGCEPCIWDTYTAELAQYRVKLAQWQARQAAKGESAE